MVTQYQVKDCLMEHPEWTARQIAAALGCQPAYVRATCRRKGWRHPKAKPRGAQPRHPTLGKLKIISRAMYDLLIALRQDATMAIHHREIDAILERIT